MQVPAPASARSWLRRHALLGALAAVALALLTWRVGERALWQDEAACAVLAERLLATGRPLAYDGQDLITMDLYRPEEGPELARRAADPDATVAFHVEKGDFRADTTWIGQPWGQFVWPALSFALFGHGTLQARLPFVLCGALTVAGLFAFARRRTGSTALALSAALLCLGSAYWVLHVRQCRYYAASSLFALVTVAAYFRWQDAPRSLARSVFFVLSAWAWFQHDFGSVWPALGVLALDAGWRAWRAGRADLVRVLATFAVLALLIVPFLPYYELLVLRDGALASGRFKEPTAPFAARLAILAAYLNQFQLPLVLAPCLPLLAWRRGRTVEPGARLALVSLAVVLATLVWMALVGPFPFYRYVVATTPLAGLALAWGIVTLARRVVAPGPRATALASTLVALVLLTPWAAWPGRALLPVPERVRALVPPAGVLVRHELRVLAEDLAQRRPDPNGALVAFLRARLRPGDEVAINYEEAPLVFYLENAVRGGVGCFRLAAEPPPRFLVLRSSVPFTHRAPYEELLARRRWSALPNEVPDVTWGNNPDPFGRATLAESLRPPPLAVFEDMGPLDGD